ncbi:estradiol 17-beta-dehydrogenase 2 [Octopus bimaculoides]|uniref:Estradiol 17-beta-dehydrogenase 2 n=1 Tax=Octopus bimaculoides TaxID=37653 RepID=A0A0L8G3V6_OCTBM|nr:estradiol 17-beta-dehydrogenase 2 [Octopus bimaculoides]|eukprot:XP_014784328.1 PREDICTED: estradiol 17-beta-dehydrogenase 2-like [Octopus bimaculoides]
MKSMMTVNDRVQHPDSSTDSRIASSPDLNTEKEFYSSSNYYMKFLMYIILCLLILKLLKKQAIIRRSLFIKFILLAIVYCMTVSSSTQSYHLDFIVLAISILVVHRNTPTQKLPVNNKAVFITGCDRGFGHALAIKLDQLGFKVFAGCLDKSGDGAAELKEKCSNLLHILQLDVSDQSEIDSAFKTVTDNLENYILWGLVNNAGICYIGNSEIISTTDSLKLMDVNFRGPFLLCRKFLPLLRRSQGRIVNVSSNAGLAPVALMGAYCCSKSALFMLSEVLRAENERWGVKVSTIVPSGYKTGIIAYDKIKMAEKWWAEAPTLIKEDFGEEAFVARPKAGDSDEMLSADISPVINAMIDGLLSQNPQFVYYKGFLSRLIPFCYMHLPTILRQPVMHVLADWFEFQHKWLQEE